MRLAFTKLHGCANDYVYVDCTERPLADAPAIARVVSDRRTGIGSDGLILVCPSEAADFRMEMYNADGSRGKMCGNGIRAFAKYVRDHGLTDRDRLAVDTDAGVKTLDLERVDGKVARASRWGGPNSKARAFRSAPAAASSNSRWKSMAAPGTSPASRWAIPTA